MSKVKTEKKTYLTQISKFSFDKFCPVTYVFAVNADHFAVK